MAIADSGSSVLTQTIVVAVASAFGGWVFRTMVARPGEKAEQYEEAKLKAIADSLAEHKQTYQHKLSEWEQWRENQSQRITTLENNRTSLNEKLKELAGEVTETKRISVDIQKTLASLTSKMDATINKWSH